MSVKSISGTFTYAMPALAEAPHYTASVTEEVVLPLRGSLADLWAKTDAVKMVLMPGWDIIVLRIEDVQRPTRITDGDGWLATINRTDVEGQWEVGVWKEQLENNKKLFTDARDMAAARAILKDITDGHDLSQKTSPSEPGWIMKSEPAARARPLVALTPRP